jgi:glycosyltransferase involved in cell wall biosynthesis
MQIVSVITPAYKAATYLLPYLNSVGQQLEQPAEVLIGIDACDETKQALKVVSKSEYTGPLKVYYFDTHAGAYIIRNTLVNLSIGSALCFFDIDDIMLTTHIQHLHTVLNDNPKSVIKSRYRELYSEGVLKRCGHSNGECFMSTSTFMQLNGFESWPCSADTEFLQRAKQSNIPIVLAPGDHTCLYYRANRNSLTTAAPTSLKSELRLKLKAEINNRAVNPIQLTSLTTANCELIYEQA